MCSKVLDAKQCTFPNIWCSVLQTLVEKWKQIFRLQVSVKVGLFRNTLPLSSISTHGIYAAICLIKKRSILRCKVVTIHIILRISVIIHEIEMILHTLLFVLELF